MSGFKKHLYKVIFFRLMGWKIVGEMNPEVKKCILVIIPHTSWHDFYIGLFARGIIGLEMHYVAKKELFDSAFGWYFRWMGGSPLNRSGNRNTVDDITQMFSQKKVFRLAIAPEGTRKKVSALRTGFYYIAVKAHVPLVPVAFDYRKREVSIGNPFHPTGNIDTDLKQFLQHYSGVVGKIPEYSFVV